MTNAFSNITVEISGICNARCLWCYTGRKNRNRRQAQTAKGCKPHFMSAAAFAEGLTYLQDKQLINKQTEIELYNWGEPLLNPELDSILQEIDSRRMPFHISTNCADISHFSGSHLRYMTLFMVSLSGFSQHTYGKIHGFPLERVLQNIDRVAECLKRAGKLHTMEINFHVYQFNLHEIATAAAYFRARGIRFVPRLAYFNDYGLFQGYLQKTLPPSVAARAQQHLLTDLLDKELLYAPESYSCPQWSKLVVDDFWNLIPCCRLTQKEQQGNLLTMTAAEIKEKKGHIPQCAACLQFGQSYLVHREMVFEYGLSDHLTPRRMQPILLLDEINRKFRGYGALRTGLPANDGHYCERFTLAQPPKRMRFAMPALSACSVLSDFHVDSNCGPLQYTAVDGKQQGNLLLFENKKPAVLIDIAEQEITWIEISCEVSSIAPVLWDKLHLDAEE